jgi:cytochrome P450
MAHDIAVENTVGNTVHRFGATLPVLHHNPLLPDAQTSAFNIDTFVETGLSWWPEGPYGGVAVVDGHDLVRQILADPETFGSANAIDTAICGGIGAVTAGKSAAVTKALSGLPPEPTVVINFDGEQHRRLRTVFNQGFTRQRIELRTGLIENTADQAIASFADRGCVELGEEFVRRWWPAMVNDFYGYPREDTPLIAEFCRAVTVLGTPDYPEPDQFDAAAQLHRAHRYLRRQVALRRPARPEHARDLIYDLVHATTGTSAGALAFPEIFWNLLVSRVAAEGTTRLLLLAAVELMLRHGYWQQAAAARRPERADLIRQCVEETLRINNPHGGLLRITTRPVVLGTWALPAGAPLLLDTAAANRDPAVFADPHEVRLDRRNRRDHLAFGHGVHACVGATLARTMVRVAIEALLRQLPTLRLRDPDQPAPPVAHLLVNGPDAVHLTWDTSPNNRPDTGGQSTAHCQSASPTAEATR